MTVNISQQQPYQHQDLHLKRKASENAENEQRLSKRFHQLNIHPDYARNNTPVTSADTATPILNNQHHIQNNYAVQPFQSLQVSLDAAAASTISSHLIAPQYSPSNHDTHTSPSSATPISSFPHSYLSSDAEAMQIEELPSKFSQYNPSVTDDESGSSNAGTTTTTDDDGDDGDDEEEDMNNQPFLKSNRRKPKHRKDRVILIPTIDKHIDKIPAHVLRDKNSGNNNLLPGSSSSTSSFPSSSSSSGAEKNKELILYSDPSSLSVPKERDSVRKVILESRARARLGAENGAGLNRRLSGGLLSNEIGNGMGAGVAAGDVAAVNGFNPNLNGPLPGTGTSTSGTTPLTPRSVPEAMAQDMQMDQRMGAASVRRGNGSGYGDVQIGGGGGSSGGGRIGRDALMMLDHRAGCNNIMSNTSAPSLSPSPTAIGSSSGAAAAAASSSSLPTALFPARTSSTTIDNNTPVAMTSSTSSSLPLPPSSSFVLSTNIDPDAMDID